MTIHPRGYFKDGVEADSQLTLPEVKAVDLTIAPLNFENQGLVQTEAVEQLLIPIFKA